MASVITAVVPVLACLGGAGAFIWRRVEARFRLIEKKLDECEKREAAQTERRVTHLVVIELLWAEVRRLSPTENPTLARAAQLLDRIKTMDRADYVQDVERHK